MPGCGNRGKTLRPHINAAGDGGNALIAQFIFSGHRRWRPFFTTDDRAAILGMASLMGLDLESAGFSVIPCCGKASLDRPTAIFRELGIPVYVIWDGDKNDKDAKPEDNHRLLRLVGEPVEDWPSFVNDKCACFSVNLETTLREELKPENFDKWLGECQTEFVISKRKHAMKNPLVIASILKKALDSKQESKTLKAIVEKVATLKK